MRQLHTFHRLGTPSGAVSFVRLGTPSGAGIPSLGGLLEAQTCATAVNYGSWGAQKCSTVVNYGSWRLTSSQRSSIIAPGGSKVRNCRQLWLLEAHKCATVIDYGSWRLTSAQRQVLQISCPPNLLSSKPPLQASCPPSLLSYKAPVLQSSCPPSLLSPCRQHLDDEGGRRQRRSL